MSQSLLDLNCDLGEYEHLSDAANDAAIMPYLSSCNVACGGHAGNQTVIEHTVDLALSNGVHVGAHPAYPDRQHFGRRVMRLSAQELRSSISDQVMLVKTAVESKGDQLWHVKPHGALYNQAVIDFELAVLLAEVVAAIDSELLFFGLANSPMQQAAESVGLQFVAEGFADRAYTAAGHLVPRSEPGAVITDVRQMTTRIVGLLKHGHIQALTGTDIALQIDTLCLHGDHNNSLTTAANLHAALLQAGISIQAPARKHD